MLFLLAELANRNNFQLILEPSNYYPTKSELRRTIASLPKDAVYVNHCNYLSGLPEEEYVWINIARDPIELEESYYYYRVAPTRMKMAEEERQRRLQDPCGCPNMEFDQCRRSYLTNDLCRHRMKFNNSAIKTFREATEDIWENQDNGNFTGPQAFNRVYGEYAFVGITEEMELTVMALEKLLPRQFAHATELYRKLSLSTTHVNETPKVNVYTGTEMNGAVSTLVTDALKRYNSDDIGFYENVRRLFWWRVISLFPNFIAARGY